jgi:coenzyme F420-reducing hydrogenase delta subunit
LQKLSHKNGKDKKSIYGNRNLMADISLQIVAYCCEHCAYAAADLAGGLRIQYPPDVKIVQLPCTGKLDVLMVLQALEDGLDGVMVAG